MPRSLAPMILSLALLGCAAPSPDDGSDPGDPDPGGPDPGAGEIDALIRGIAPLPSASPSVVEGQAGEPRDEGDYRCVLRPVAETRQHDELVAFSANSESMWPGALLRGDSVYSGLFTQIVRPRAPATVSVSLENLDGHRSAVMDSPSLSSFREAVAGIVEQEVTGATPANIYAEIESIHSEQQLAVALGASVSVTGAPAQLAASFNFSDQTIRSRYLVTYVQSYYTVDVDQPSSPSSVFGDDVTASDLAEVMGEGNPPVYVSSVTFGRIVLFTFESSHSADELGSALEFVYSGGAEVSGNVSLTHREVVSGSKVTAYVLGGSGGDAAQSLGSYEEILEFIRSGGDYSRSSPGAPIAYKLAYLSDNAPARMSFTSEYSQKECQRVTQKIAVALRTLSVVSTGADDDPDDTLEVFGLIRAQGRDGATLFDRGTGEAIEIAEGDSWPDEGYIAEAILSVDPREGAAIVLDASLSEQDDVLGDDPLGSQELVVPFETGWRRDLTLHLTAGGSDVAVVISLTPI